LVGTGTEFTAADENKRIIIKARTYVIDQVDSPTLLPIVSAACQCGTPP